MKVIAPTVLFAAFYVRFYRQQVEQQVRHAYDAAGGLLGKKRLTLTPEGFEEAGPHSTTRQQWAGLHAVPETPTAIYLFVAPGAAHIVPKRAFEDAAAAAESLGAARRHRDAKVF